MIRGTTPTHTFTLPFDASMIKVVKVIYAQSDIELFHHKSPDCQINGNEVSVTLTQEETFKFNCKKPVQIQIRVLLTDGSAHASELCLTDVDKCLDSEVLM